MLCNLLVVKSEHDGFGDPDRDHLFCKLSQSIAPLPNDLASRFHLPFEFRIIRSQAKAIRAFRQEERVALIDLQARKRLF